MRGLEMEWRWERDRGKDVGVTGGSGDCRNKEEKGKKRAILSQVWPQIWGYWVGVLGGGTGTINLVTFPVLWLDTFAP